MLAAKVAIAEVKAELGVSGNKRCDADQARGNRLPRRIDQRKLILRLPIPQDHVVANIPLDAQVIVRDMLADRLHLTRHGGFVRSLDRGDITRGAEGIDDAHRRGQTDLEAHARRNVSTLSCRNEIEIRRPRLPGVAELAKTHLVQCSALSEAEKRKS